MKNIQNVLQTKPEIKKNLEYLLFEYKFSVPATISGYQEYKVEAGHTLGDALSISASDNFDQNTIEKLDDVFELSNISIEAAERTLLGLTIDVMKICYIDKLINAWNKKVLEYNISDFYYSGWDRSAKLFISNASIFIFINFGFNRIKSVKEFKNVRIDFKLFIYGVDISNAANIYYSIDEINIQKLEDWFKKELGKIDM